jgi:hypothetical protein
MVGIELGEPDSKTEVAEETARICQNERRRSFMEKSQLNRALKDGWVLA